MSIDTAKSINPLTDTQNIANVTKAPAQKTPEHANATFAQSSAQVTLSRAADYLNEDSADIDTDRVAQIKHTLSRGELTLDAGKIADAMLSNIHHSD